MDVIFNVTKEERKALVSAVSEITGWSAVYKGAPSFAFAVNNYTIDRNGTLNFDERTGAEEVRTLLMGLTERGFSFEGNIDEIIPVVPAHTDSIPDALASGEVTPDNAASEGASNEETAPAVASVIETPDSLIIEVPLSGFTRTALDNLERLISGKAVLIMKALGAEALPIKRTESTIQFPWFPFPASKDATEAYMRFVCALCDLAKKQKRVTMKESSAESDGSEKFAFRCFLLRLGFVGGEYKSARKVLLSKLSGNGSFKTGDHKREAATEAVTNADSGAENAEVITAHENEHSANSAATGGQDAMPVRCGDCSHHCYHTDEPLLTSSGDAVNTVNRTPDKYTHYCLGVPSGFRKIKHATDWSGSETAPKWCPLQSESNNGIADENENDTQTVPTVVVEASYTYNPDLSGYDALMARGGN